MVCIPQLNAGTILAFYRLVKWEINLYWEDWGRGVGMKEAGIRESKAPFTRQKIFGTARMKKVRVPKQLVRHG